jgi:integrase
VRHGSGGNRSKGFLDSLDLSPCLITQAQSKLLSVRDAATRLGVSECWVRRHLAELPVIRVGRLVRFDPMLLLEKFSGTMQGGKPLRSERAPMLSRYQRGYVYQSGRKQKSWYAMFREDVNAPDGKTKRKQRNVRLGTVAELPTKNAARNKLAELMKNSNPDAVLSFTELTQRWQKAEGPTMKPTTLSHYENALRAYVIPTFGTRLITDIKREDVQLFLAKKAKHYSRSALRSMRVVLSLTFGWARNNGWLQHNPCEGVRLPLATGGRTVTRTILTTEQVNALAGKLDEPYATFILFLASSGLRIGEAIAVKWSDFQGNVLHITRRIYDGDVGAVKSAHSVRQLPITSDLIERMRALGGKDWIFRSRTGTPFNPGNVLKRYVRPAAKQLGIAIGGWHDFRHSLTTAMRRNGVHPKVVSGILGHAKVALAMDVYDHANVEDFRQPLAFVSDELLRNVMKNADSA